MSRTAKPKDYKPKMPKVSSFNNGNIKMENINIDGNSGINLDDLIKSSGGKNINFDNTNSQGAGKDNKDDATKTEGETEKEAKKATDSSKDDL